MPNDATRTQIVSNPSSSSSVQWVRLPSVSGLMRTLARRELRRVFSGWVPTKPGEPRLLHQIRKWCFGYLKAVWIMLGFPLVAVILANAVLRGQTLGVAVVGSNAALLVVLTVVGYGGIGLTAASVTDDWKILGRESLWGVKAWQHILSKFVGILPPATVLGLLTAGLFVSSVKMSEDSLFENNLVFCSILLTVYSWACAALGLAVSSLVRGTRSTIFVLMSVLSMFVLLSGVPIALDDLDDPMRGVLLVASMFMPSRWAGGAWAAQIELEKLNPLDSHGFPWISNWGTLALDATGLVACIALYIAIATVLVKLCAPKILLNR